MWTPWVWLGRIGEYCLHSSKLGSNTDLRPAAVGPYCTPISQNSDGILRYVLARLTVFYQWQYKSLEKQFPIGKMFDVILLEPHFNLLFRNGTSYSRTFFNIPFSSYWTSENELCSSTSKSNIFTVSKKDSNLWCLRHGKYSALQNSPFWNDLFPN